MNTFTKSLAAFGLAALVLVGAGCGGSNASISDLVGTWVVDADVTAEEAVEALEGAEFTFADNQLTITLNFLGTDATMVAPYEEQPVGSEGDQAEADFAVKFTEFQLSAAGEEETLTADEAPFDTVHMQFSDDKNKLTLYETTLDDVNNSALVRKEE